MKRVIAVLLSLTMLLALFPVISLADEEDVAGSTHITDISYDGTINRMNISYTTELREETEATAIIAGYKNGVLKGIDNVTFTIYPDRTQTTVDTGVRWYRSDWEYKLFMWDGFNSMQAISEETPVLHTPAPIGRIEEGEHYGWVMNADLTADDVKLRVMTDSGEAEMLEIADAVEYWAPNALMTSGTLTAENAKTELKKLFTDTGAIKESMFPASWQAFRTNQNVNSTLREEFTSKGLITSIWRLKYAVNGKPVTLIKYKTNQSGEIEKLYFAVSTENYDMEMYDKEYADSNWSPIEWQAAYEDFSASNNFTSIDDFKDCLGWAVQPEMLGAYQTYSSSLTAEDIKGIERPYISSQTRNALTASDALLIDLATNLSGAAIKSGLVGGYKITDDVTEFSVPEYTDVYNNEKAYVISKNVASRYNVTTNGQTNNCYAADADEILPGVLVRFIDNITIPVNPAELSTALDTKAAVVENVEAQTAEDGSAVYKIDAYINGAHYHQFTDERSAFADVTGFETSNRMYVTDGTIWDARSSKPLSDYLKKGDVIISDGTHILRIKSAENVYEALKDGKDPAGNILTLTTRNNYYFDKVSAAGVTDGTTWFSLGGITMAPENDLELPVVNIDLTADEAADAVTVAESIPLSELKLYDDNAGEYDYALARLNLKGYFNDGAVYRIKTGSPGDNPQPVVSDEKRLGEGERYGWVMNADLTADDVKLRVMTDSGEAETLEIADSVKYWAPNALMTSGTLSADSVKSELEKLFDSNGNVNASEFPVKWNIATLSTGVAIRKEVKEQYLSKGLNGSAWRLKYITQEKPVTLIKYKTNRSGEIEKLYFAVSTENYDMGVYDKDYADLYWSESDWQAAYEDFSASNNFTSIDDFKDCLGWGIQTAQVADYQRYYPSITEDDIKGVQRLYITEEKRAALISSDALLINLGTNLEGSLLRAGLVGGYKITDDVTEFAVPEWLGGYGGEKYYTVGKNVADKYNVTTNGLLDDAFVADENAIAPGVIVRFAPNTAVPVNPAEMDTSADIAGMVVDNIEAETDDDGFIVYKINGFRGGKEYSVTTTQRSSLAKFEATALYSTTRYPVGETIWTAESSYKLWDCLKKGDTIISDGDYIIICKSAADIYEEITENGSAYASMFSVSDTRNSYYFGKTLDYGYIDGYWWLKAENLKISPTEKQRFDIVEIDMSAQSASKAVSIDTDGPYGIMDGVYPYDGEDGDYIFTRIGPRGNQREIVIYRIINNSAD